ncbi:hypothetical protein C922_05444 [Plasmodium inui San Antonio 1]|uniref:Uncharacterized protein n=1 Tax=Plasmodium inui San Antonio 1 TaxID=1237626 RepID=W6ZTC9_9APIC|nr:hypothetical protein C922_05444 [Plasmodium inui San Antonio 1]EUD64177.1 hypothetical protein C922_05444 [Plasmodium inui San Antonio 1]
MDFIHQMKRIPFSRKNTLKYRFSAQRTRAIVLIVHSAAHTTTDWNEILIQTEMIKKNERISEICSWFNDAQISLMKSNWKYRNLRNTYMRKLLNDWAD